MSDQWLADNDQGASQSAMDYGHFQQFYNANNPPLTLPPNAEYNLQYDQQSQYYATSDPNYTQNGMYTYSASAYQHQQQYAGPPPPLGVAEYHYQGQHDPSVPHGSMQQHPQQPNVMTPSYSQYYYPPQSLSSSSDYSSYYAQQQQQQQTEYSYNLPAPASYQYYSSTISQLPTQGESSASTTGVMSKYESRSVRDSESSSSRNVRSRHREYNLQRFPRTRSPSPPYTSKRIDSRKRSDSSKRSDTSYRNYVAPPSKTSVKGPSMPPGSTSPPLATRTFAGGASSVRRRTLTTSLQPRSERDLILSKWRRDFCATGDQYTDKLQEMIDAGMLDCEKVTWTRSTPGDLFYQRDPENPGCTRGTDRLRKMCTMFNHTLVKRADRARALLPKYTPPPRKNRARLCKHKTEQGSSSDSSSEEMTDEEDCTMEELTRKQMHPHRLHPEMWYNDPGEMNDGPLCRCSQKSRKSGIRHGIYPGENHLGVCDKNSNNGTSLYHYRVTISPPTNFLIKTPTIVQYDEHEFIFEGFSMFSHTPLVELPTCKVIRFNIEYTILYLEEKMPDNFTIRELDLFHDYLFRELLELVDLDFKAAGDGTGCSQFHFMPRFVRELPNDGKEILSMNEVLQYLLKSSLPIIIDSQLEEMVKMSQYEWQSYADEIKGMVVTYPGKKPCSVRVDQLDRNIEQQVPGAYTYPEIVHFGIRPPQLSYAGNPDYQKAWREYVKFRHLLANMSKPTYEDKRRLEVKETKLQDMRTQSKMKRDVTIAVSAAGFYRTGIMCDIIQHAMLLPILVCHLRFHNSLNMLESNIQYKFKNRFLLQLALTHPSYRENFGTNPDHARNSLTNCGIRQPEYGDRRIHYMNTRKRGINTLINIMSRFGKKYETESNITHNERLEFLGDAVVEFLSSIHLFYSFPELEEGGLATYRAAIVQNQHLAVLARTLRLDKFMLYAHGSDLCHDLELRHAMANCYEALMGALFLDGGIEVVDKVFSETLYKNKPDMLNAWVNYPPHPLQEQEPLGDRAWIEKFELLSKLTDFEVSIGVKFTHIRLLARAFTDRSVGYTNLTLGSNQRLEFLGDTVLQLIASDYLYKFFPEHHEGHLSLLRSSLVNNRTQAVVCDDLDMSKYAVYNNPKAELKTKDRADLLEAFIGALYVDKGLVYCETFCQVTLFPRLQDFIMNQDWNDPKSKLQQCCLTLRSMDGGEPDIPVYKVIECKGPTNTRVYTVAVYFRGRRLANALGHSIQQAEMNAAKKALELSHDLFPQLDHQRRVIAKSMKKQNPPSIELPATSSSESKSSAESRAISSSASKTAESPDTSSSRKSRLPTTTSTSSLASNSQAASSSATATSRASTNGPSLKQQTSVSASAHSSTDQDDKIICLDDVTTDKNSKCSGKEMLPSDPKKMKLTPREASAAVSKCSRGQASSTVPPIPVLKVLPFSVSANASSRFLQRSTEDGVGHRSRIEDISDASNDFESDAEDLVESEIDTDVESDSESEVESDLESDDDYAEYGSDDNSMQVRVPATFEDVNSDNNDVNTDAESSSEYVSSASASVEDDYDSDRDSND